MFQKVIGNVVLPISIIPFSCRSVLNTNTQSCFIYNCTRNLQHSFFGTISQEGMIRLSTTPNFSRNSFHWFKVNFFNFGTFMM